MRGVQRWRRRLSSGATRGVARGRAIQATTPVGGFEKFTRVSFRGKFSGELFVLSPGGFLPLSLSQLQRLPA